MLLLPEGRDMKFRIQIIFISSIFLLFSCTSATPAATPTSIPTSIPTATPTKLPPPEFSASVIGYEEHGAMIELVCEAYCPTSEDIKSLNVKVYQNDQLIEKQPIEIIEDRYLIEIQDSFYELGSISIFISNPEYKIEITNIEFEERFPFFRWIFGDYGLTRNVFGGFRDNHPAWDMVLITDDFPKSVGAPIYALSNGEMITNQIWYPFEGREEYVTNIYAYLNDVGLLWQIGHIDAESPPIETGTCTEFIFGDLVAKIGKLDAVSSDPHVHFQIQTLNQNFWYTIDEEPKCTCINPFENDPFNDGETNLRFGLFLPEYLPDEVKIAFENDFFIRNTYISSYDVCLSTSGFSYIVDFSSCDSKYSK